MSKLLELISDIMPMDVAKYVVMPYVVETREHWKEKYDAVMSDLECFPERKYKIILGESRRSRIRKRLKNTYNRRYGDDRFNAVLSELNYVSFEKERMNRKSPLGAIIMLFGLLPDPEYMRIKTKVLGFDSKLINKKYASNYLYQKDEKAFAPDYIRYKYEHVLYELKNKI